MQNCRNPIPPVRPGIFSRMDSEFSQSELESLRKNLVILGEKAAAAQKYSVVDLVNFYWKMVDDQLKAFRPLWREAA